MNKKPAKTTKHQNYNSFSGPARAEGLLPAKSPKTVIKTLVYLPLELRAELEKAAEADVRSLSNEIVFLVQQSLACRKARKARIARRNKEGEEEQA